MSTLITPDLAPDGPQLIPHSDAWRRAQSEARQRDRKVRRASGNLLKQVVDAARARVPDVNTGALPQAGSRAQLKEARRAYGKEANRFLPRSTRRELARGIKVAS